MEKIKNKIVVLAIVLILFGLIAIGRYLIPVCPECPDVLPIKVDTLTIVEYRDTTIFEPEYIYVTGTVVDTANTGSESEVFVPEILRTDTSFVSGAKLEIEVNEATNDIQIEYYPAPVKIREVTLNTIVTEIKEVPMPTPLKEKAKLISIGIGIGIVISAILILS